MNSIVVRIEDYAWTLQAMHLACSMARMTGGDVVLLHLMPVNTPVLLGFDLILKPPTDEEEMAIEQYGMIAEDYGVNIAVHRMQYTSLPDALVQVGEHLNATAIFARLPKRALPFMHKIELWNVQRQLAAHGGQLYTLEQPQNTNQDVPVISLRPVKR